MEPYVFEDFFREHYPQVRSALILALGSVEAAEDATQEAFVRACVRWTKVRGMERPAAWVYVTAVNAARDEHRRMNRRPRHDQDHVGGGSVDEIGQAVDRLDIVVALELLAPRQRTAIVLRYLASHRNEEVAQAKNCSVGTVKSTLHSALKKLRVELEEEVAS
jgi:RNA polymerase sigma-70 factor (ECF subfamily)